jgi:hypothetical protein
MRIRVANAVRQTGEPFPFEAAEAFAPQRFGERAVSFAGPVTVSGTYYDGKAFTVSAKAKAAVDTCVRALHQTVCRRGSNSPFPSDS